MQQPDVRGLVQPIGPIDAVATPARLNGASAQDGAGIGPISAQGEPGVTKRGGGGAVGASACPTPRHPEFRIAMLLPWLSSSPAHDGHLPAWLPFFLATRRWRR